MKPFLNGHTREDILVSPELQSNIANYFIDVYNRCKENSNYFTSMIWKLQHDVKINHAVAKYIVDNGVSQKIFIKKSNDLRMIRFSDKCGVPNVDMLLNLLSVDDGMKYIEVEIREESEVNFIKRFSRASIIKEAKERGFNIKLLKPEITI